MPEPTIDQLVVFAILMENDKGVESKSEAYVKEKFNSVCRTDNTVFLMQMLDPMNVRKYERWKERWGSEED